MKIRIYCQPLNFTIKIDLKVSGYLTFTIGWHGQITAVYEGINDIIAANVMSVVVGWCPQVPWCRLCMLTLKPEG